MNFSNLQSFHHAILLQNATALPSRYYRSFNNRNCTQVEVLTQAIDVSIEPLALPTPVAHPLPQKNIETALELPRSNESSILADLPHTSRLSVTKRRMVWKPGRGTIEKVDKLTGEIVHLVEEHLPTATTQKVYWA